MVCTNDGAQIRLNEMFIILTANFANENKKEVKTQFGAAALDNLISLIKSIFITHERLE